MNEVQKDIPGPGNYDHELDKGKAFTIQGRHEDKVNDMPGPGSYNNDKLDLVKANS